MGNKQKKHGCLWWVLVALWWLYIGWWWRPLRWIIRRGISKNKAQPPNTSSRDEYSLPFSENEAKSPSPKAAPTASGDELYIPSFEQGKSAPETVSHAAKTEHHKVAGISYRTENLLTLGTPNSDYDLSKSELIEEGLTGERIYRTDFHVKHCELVPEPENPHDSKAIKVVVDGVHIGYIKSGSCAHIHKLLRENLIQTIQCEIGGGKYKIVLEDYDENGDPAARVESETAPYFAVVSITQKP